MIFWILIELPFFYFSYKNNNIDTETHLFKKFEPSWVKNFFGLLVSYYVQPFVFSLRNELLLPSLRRTKKIAKISVISECALFIIIGFSGYFVLGDKMTPELFIKRKPYDGKSAITEGIYIFLICCFLILNTLGLSMYNTSIRDYLKEFIDFTKDNKKYIMVSLIPFACICGTAAVWPNIEDALTFFGYTVYNFNGYIVPLLMGIATY